MSGYIERTRIERMKRATQILFIILLTGSALQGAEPEVWGTIYFDRGHYWIELTIERMGGGSPPPALLDKKNFEIIRIGDEAFRPSRVEVIDWEMGEGVLLLSSGKLKGRACYSVAVELDSALTISAEPFCDPFLYEPGAEECATKSFFRRYVAPAFGRSGDGYGLNRFKYEYELHDGESKTALTLQPSFEIGDWGIELSFDQHETRYETMSGDRSPTSKRTVGLEISRSGWAGLLGARFSGSYRHERARVQAADGDSTLFGQDIRILALARLDNLLDTVNRHCVSVFKGVDMGFGYAWYASSDEEVWGEGGIDSTTPLLLLRFTWTFLYGLQFSYALESAFPSELGERFEEFHTVKFRLLLRDLLEREERRPYHPDLEFVYESGRNLPLFEYERRITVGFTFDLFPW